MAEHGAISMKRKIDECIIKFFNMNSEERIDYIKGYKFMQPYQKVALLQSKRYMNSAEKRVYSQVKQSESTEQSEPNK